MIEVIFTELVSAGGEFITMLSSLFSSVVAIFYTAGTGDAAGSLTVVGTLTLISVAIGFVMWIIHWVTSLIKVGRH